MAIVQDARRLITKGSSRHHHPDGQKTEIVDIIDDAKLEISTALPTNQPLDSPRKDVKMRQSLKIWRAYCPATLICSISVLSSISFSKLLTGDFSSFWVLGTEPRGIFTTHFLKSHIFQEHPASPLHPQTRATLLVSLSYGGAGLGSLLFLFSFRSIAKIPPFWKQMDLPWTC